MTEPDPSLPHEARAALDALEEARDRVAAVADSPPWRHAIFGLVMALLVLGCGLDPAVQLACVALAMLGVWLIVRDDRVRYGELIGDYRRGATRPHTFALLVAVLALGALQYALRSRGVPIYVPFLVALAAFALATWSSVHWNRTFRRALRDRR